MMIKYCVYILTYTDEQGGSETGIARLATGLPFALAEMEKWQADNSERPCTVRCSTIPPELRRGVEQLEREAI